MATKNITSATLHLFAVTGTLGEEHLVLAASKGHAVQVVTKSFHVSPRGYEARMLTSDLAKPQIIRSDYPEDD